MGKLDPDPQSTSKKEPPTKRDFVIDWSKIKVNPRSDAKAGRDSVKDAETCGKSGRAAIVAARKGDGGKMALAASQARRKSALSKGIRQLVAQPPDWLARSMVEIPGEGPDGILLPQHYGDLVEEDRPAVTWADFQGWVEELDDRWSFRGHAVANWRLEATLERATTQLVAASIGTVFHISRQKLRPGPHEKELLLEFQRGAHQYMALTPAEDEVVDWLALMQHHGAPTRLLDWTRSPYVALYFAL